MGKCEGCSWNQDPEYCYNPFECLADIRNNVEKRVKKEVADKLQHLSDDWESEKFTGYKVFVVDIKCFIENELKNNGK